MAEAVFSGTSDDLAIIERVLVEKSIDEFERADPKNADGAALAEIFVAVSTLLKDQWPLIIALLVARDVRFSVNFGGQTYNSGDNKLPHILEDKE